MSTLIRVFPAFCVILMALPVQAQVTTGTLTGQVTDPMGKGDGVLVSWDGDGGFSVRRM